MIYLIIRYSYQQTELPQAVKNVGCTGTAHIPVH